MRKEAGFDVVDRIRVHYEAGPRLKAAVDRFASRVAGETLADSPSKLIERISEGKEVVLNDFPYNLRRIIERSGEISFLLKLFKGFKLA